METHSFFISLVIILLTARLLAELAKKFQVPPVIGELLAGILLGPSLLGWVDLTPVIKLLAEIGIILLLFEVGLETDVMRLVRVGFKSIVVAVAGFIFPFLFGFLLSYLVFEFSLLTSLFIGGTLTATSIGITVKVLGDLNLQQSEEGRIVLGAGVMDDVLGVVLLALLYDFSLGGSVSLLNAGGIFAFIILFLLIAPISAKLLSLVIERFHKVRKVPGWLPTAIISLVMFFAWLAHIVGAPEFLGGFAAGLALSKYFFFPFHQQKFADVSDFNQKVHEQITPIIRLFTPIFFVVVGLSINLKEIDWGSSFIWIFSLTLFVLAVLGKLAGGWLTYGPWVRRWCIGLAMIPRGEVGLVFAELGLETKILNHDIYAGLVFVIALTTLLPPFVLKWVYKHYGERLEEPISK
jgi:Kef-type K+ transport system membrane component KefB